MSLELEEELLPELSLGLLGLLVALVPVLLPVPGAEVSAPASDRIREG